MANDYVCGWCPSMEHHRCASEACQCHAADHLPKLPLALKMAGSVVLDPASKDQREDYAKTIIKDAKENGYG